MGQGAQGHLLGSRTPPCGKEAFLSLTDLPQGCQDVLQRTDSWKQEIAEAAPLYIPSGVYPLPHSPADRLQLLWTGLSAPSLGLVRALLETLFHACSSGWAPGKVPGIRSWLAGLCWPQPRSYCLSRSGDRLHISFTFLQKGSTAVDYQRHLDTEVPRLGTAALTQGPWSRKQVGVSLQTLA